MKITIAGTPGSGKSTLAKGLAKALNLESFHVGDLRRQMANDHGMSLAEFNELGEKEDWTDKELDKYQKTLGKEKDNFVFESRLGWHFIPDSIKVFLDADEKIRAERILGRKKPEESFNELNQVIEANRKRIESDDKRYKQYYGIDKAFDPSHFDIVVDSSNKQPEETLKEALEKVEGFANCKEQDEAQKDSEPLSE